MRNWMKFFLIALVLAAVVGLGFWWQRDGNGNRPAYRTAKVSRGELAVTISATGTVQPEEVIDVGAQIAGRVLEFGVDAAGQSIDYGSVVKKGMVLARIDDAVYLTDVDQARAQLQAAIADVRRAEAELRQQQSKLVLAEQDWHRAMRLGPSEALSQADFDAVKAAYETAGAAVAGGEAAVMRALAGQRQAQAALTRAQRNLGYCTITSPVDGVIIDRRVNIGQTVVASLNAPSLFLIAKDLTRIQVWVAVNEADIGRIRPGLSVNFTVDAFPGEIFRGEVGKIRLNASMTQNIVTYTVEILTDNASGRLLPYLTANVTFELERYRDVLLVPNAALRWSPPERAGARQRRNGGGEGQSRRETGQDEGRGERGTLWILDGRDLHPVEVRRGASDGVATLVESEGVREGMAVVVGLQQSMAGEDKGTAGNPFTPQFLSRTSQGGARR